MILFYLIFSLLTINMHIINDCQKSDYHSWIRKFIDDVENDDLSK